eukprot:3767410-Prymnesium_polylepis.1
MVVRSSRTIAVAKSSISTLRRPAERASTSSTGRNPVVASPVGAVSPCSAAAAAMWVSNSATCVSRMCVCDVEPAHAGKAWRARRAAEH